MCFMNLHDKPKFSCVKLSLHFRQNKCGIFSFIGSPSNAALSRKAEEVIINVAFNAINIKQISGSQLAAAAKPLKLKLKPSLSKEEYLKPVADGLIKAGYVKFTKELIVMFQLYVTI